MNRYDITNTLIAVIITIIVVVGGLSYLFTNDVTKDRIDKMSYAFSSPDCTNGNHYEYCYSRSINNKYGKYLMYCQGFNNYTTAVNESICKEVSVE